MKARFIAVIFYWHQPACRPESLKGKIKDARTGEEIIGASVMVKEEPGKGTVAWTKLHNTLVNGVKIPSPDDKNRYIPLNIFPSDLMDRLVVSKSLTADMEGDAAGGVVDMVMKDAPFSATGWALWRLVLS